MTAPSPTMGACQETSVLKILVPQNPHKINLKFLREEVFRQAHGVTETMEDGLSKVWPIWQPRIRYPLSWKKPTSTY